jgi:hypothetical protein
LAGGVLGLGLVVGGSKKSNKPSKLPGKYKNSAKTAGFPALFALKIAENTIFYFKVLNNIYSRDVF